MKVSDVEKIAEPSRLLSLPDTPAGNRFIAFLDAFNTGEADAIRRALTEHGGPALFAENTLDERVLFDMDLHSVTHGFEPQYLDRVEEYHLSGIACALLTGEWFRFRLEVDPDPPHLIRALNFRPAQRPDGNGAHLTLSDSEIALAVDGLLDKLLAYDLFSGAVMITHRRTLIYQRVCGLACQSFNIPNRLDTRFNIGSICKSFTAVAIAGLVQQGKLSFDDLLIKHLPDYPHEVASKVKIHHLLTHTSGLGRYFNEKFEAARSRLRAVADYIPLFIDDPLAFEPGAKWQYSDSAFILLGLVIERISGQSYFDYVREHVYQPAAMTSTDAYEMDRPNLNLAIGYTRTGLRGLPEPGPRRNNLFMHVVKGGPAGGAFSTVEDLQNFAGALLDHRLLNAEYTALVLEKKAVMGNGGKRHYAYGFIVDEVGDARVVGHSATFPGIGARMDIYLDHDYIVTILSNYDPHITQMLGNKIREMIAGY